MTLSMAQGFVPQRRSATAPPSPMGTTQLGNPNPSHSGPPAPPPNTAGTIRTIDKALSMTNAPDTGGPGGAPPAAPIPGNISAFLFQAGSVPKD